VLSNNPGTLEMNMLVTALLFPILATMAAAFQSMAPRGIQTRQHHDIVFTLHASTINEELTISDKISNLVIASQEELLSNQSLLEKKQPLCVNATDDELRSKIAQDQIIYEAILSSRFDMPFLDRVEVALSTIKGAGRGLFAKEDIMEGGVITCYPGDALLCRMPTGSSEDENDKVEGIDGEEEDDEYVDEVALWGAHVSNENRWDEDVLFDGDESKGLPSLTGYAVSVDDQYSVMGHPLMDENPAYLGHFANDGAGHLALEKSNSLNNLLAALELGLDINEEDSIDDDDDDDEIGVEENIAAYVLKSLEVANAMHTTVGKTADGGDLPHMVTVATRDIKCGEEILATYGPEYWVGHEI